MNGNGIWEVQDCKSWSTSRQPNLQFEHTAKNWDWHKANFMQNICVLKTIVINLHNRSNQISKSRILSSMNPLISFIQMPYTVAFREMTKNFPSADYSLAQLSSSRPGFQLFCDFTLTQDGWPNFLWDIAVKEKMILLPTPFFFFWISWLEICDHLDQNTTASLKNRQMSS